MAGEDDPLILQIKEAKASVLEPSAGTSIFDHYGERIEAGQRLMQSASEMLLGWTTATRKDHRQFSIRQLWDMKFSINVEMAPPDQLANYARICGWTLDWAHVRSGDAAVISGYIGKSDVFDRAIGTFARLYTDQTERDYTTFTEAIKSGDFMANGELITNFQLF
jgi:uncharacterized protein (DUF2252 family)